MLLHYTTPATKPLVESQINAHPRFCMVSWHDWNWRQQFACPIKWPIWPNDGQKQMHCDERTCGPDLASLLRYPCRDYLRQIWIASPCQVRCFWPAVDLLGWHALVGVLDKGTQQQTYVHKAVCLQDALSWLACPRAKVSPQVSKMNA